MLTLPLSDVTFSLLDTETTGLSASQGARICEVAILRVRAGKALERFQTLINPQRPIDPGAQRVHGITDEMVAASPTFAQVAPEILRLIQNSAVVCHNAPFDISFLQEEFRRLGGRLPKLPVVDTLTLSRRHFRFPSNRLGAVAQALGIEPEGWHRAGRDVQLLHGIFERFLAELRGKGVATLEDLIA